jgi:hypothetical protein
MATRYAVANGNWSNTATWDGGTLPTSADDVYANNRTVTIDQNITVISLRNSSVVSPAITAGGSFQTETSGTRTISANVIAFGTTILNVRGTCNCTLTGNVTGGSSGSNYSAVTINNLGSLGSSLSLYPVFTLNGNVTGGSVTGANGVRLWGGTMTINGSITGGTASTNATGADFYNSDNQPAAITINTGPITGGSSSGGSTAGLSISTSPTGGSLTNSFININCNLVGGTNQTSNPALSSSSSIPITIVGNLTPTVSNGATIGNSLVNVSVTGNINATGVSGIGLSIAAFNSLILNGNLTGGTSAAALYFTAWPAGTSTATVTGTLTGGSASEAAAIRIDGSASSTGTLTVNGNCVAGLGGYALRNFSGAAVTIVINGNVSGAATGSFSSVVQQGSSSTMTINGTVTGGGTSGVGANHTSGGTLIINGNVSAGGGTSAFGATNTGIGIMTINGDVTAGAGQTAYGATNGSTGRLNINGNVTAGNGNQAHGVNNSSTGTVVINGNVIGGASGGSAHGVNNASTGIIIVNGTATGGIGNSCMGAINSSTGTLIVKRAKGNGFGAGSVGIQQTYGVYSNSQGSQTYVEEIEMGSRGAFPTFNHVLFLNKSTNSALFYTSGLLSTKTLVDASVSGLMPSGYDVRNGVIYNAGNIVGTMNVPSTNNVAYNVPVDSGVGTAILRPQDVWDYMRINITGSGSIGERLKNSATVSSVGDQIAAF